jgi:hypothetical protein
VSPTFGGLSMSFVNKKLRTDFSVECQPLTIHPCSNGLRFGNLNGPPQRMPLRRLYPMAWIFGWDQKPYPRKESKTTFDIRESDSSLIPLDLGVHWILQLSIVCMCKLSSDHFMWADEQFGIFRELCPWNLSSHHQTKDGLSNLSIHLKPADRGEIKIKTFRFAFGEHANASSFGWIIVGILLKVCCVSSSMRILFHRTYPERG